MSEVPLYHTALDMRESNPNSSCKSIQPLDRYVLRSRGGRVLKAHRLMYHSTLSLGVIKEQKKKKKLLRYE